MRKGLLAALAVGTLTAVAVPTAAQAQSSLLPWPNDTFTVRDKSTDTGRRLNLPRDSMPRNAAGVPIDPTDINRADGFSPGSMLIVKVPGLDNQAAFERSRLPTLRDIARSLRRRSPIGRFPFKGSAIVMWDSGTPAPPMTNTPNRAGDDPHDNVRATPAARVQKSEFLKIRGRVVDVCGGAPCHAVP